MNKFLGVPLMLAFSLTLAACSEEKPAALVSEPVVEAKSDPGADFLFTGAKVYTVDPDQPWAEAVAVKDGKIVYVGDAAGAEAEAGSATQRFDLQGKMLLPGFVAGHEHLIASGWLSLGVDLVTADSDLCWVQYIIQQSTSVYLVSSYG